MEVWKVICPCCLPAVEKTCGRCLLDARAAGLASPVVVAVDRRHWLGRRWRGAGVCKKLVTATRIMYVQALEKIKAHALINLLQPGAHPPEDTDLVIVSWRGRVECLRLTAPPGRFAQETDEQPLTDQMEGD